MTGQGGGAAWSGAATAAAAAATVALGVGAAAFVAQRGTAPHGPSELRNLTSDNDGGDGGGDGNDSIFQDGCLPVACFKLAGRDPNGSVRKATNAPNHLLPMPPSPPPPPPPKPLLILFPRVDGEYPVLLFQHGFMMVNSYYTQLLQHIASYGFIIVAPQMYTVAWSNAKREIAESAGVINWMVEGLELAFPDQYRHAVRPDLTRLVLAGHSCGGKVAFAIAKGEVPIAIPLSALIGIDPVDGSGNGNQTFPHVLNNSEGSFNFKFPTLVIGSGLGPLRKGLFSPCAPARVGHNVFYSDASLPKYHFVLKDAGHMDFLDDSTKGLRGAVTGYVCKNGPCRVKARRCTGGLVVAFLQAALFGDREELDLIFDKPELAPVLLFPIERQESESVALPPVCEPGTQNHAIGDEMASKMDAYDDDDDDGFSGQVHGNAELSVLFAAAGGLAPTIAKSADAHLASTAASTADEEEGAPNLESAAAAGVDEEGAPDSERRVTADEEGVPNLEIAAAAVDEKGVPYLENAAAAVGSEEKATDLASATGEELTGRITSDQSEATQSSMPSAFSDGGEGAGELIVESMVTGVDLAMGAPEDVEKVGEKASESEQSFMQPSDSGDGGSVVSEEASGNVGPVDSTMAASETAPSREEEGFGNVIAVDLAVASPEEAVTEPAEEPSAADIASLPPPPSGLIDDQYYSVGNADVAETPDVYEAADVAPLIAATDVDQQSDLEEGGASVPQESGEWEKVVGEDLGIHPQVGASMSEPYVSDPYGVENH